MENMATQIKKLCQLAWGVKTNGRKTQTGLKQGTAKRIYHSKLFTPKWRCPLGGKHANERILKNYEYWGFLLRRNIKKTAVLRWSYAVEFGACVALTRYIFVYESLLLITLKILQAGFSETSAHPRLHAGTKNSSAWFSHFSHKLVHQTHLYVVFEQFPPTRVLCHLQQNRATY